MAAERPGTPRSAAPPSGDLFVGLGAGRGVPEDEVAALVADALAAAGLAAASVTALATVDSKAGEPALRAAAERLGVPLRAFPAAALAAVRVPHPSGAALAAAGTPSVAEAAALAAAGPGGVLVVPKKRSAPVGRAARATCAIARRTPSLPSDTPPPVPTACTEEPS